MIKGMRQTRFEDKDIQQLQDALNLFIQDLMGIPILQGNFIKGVELTTSGVTAVNHLLGRQALGYLVTSKSANAVVWNSSMTDKIVPLFTSANCVVDLWVF